MMTQTESILSEIATLPPEAGVSKITSYGTDELRRFARGLIACQCPECDSKDAGIVDGNLERRLCGQCGTWYRPEDNLVIALIKAFQVGAEEAEEARP